MRHDTTPASDVILGLSLGDVTGVGPEVAARAVAALDDRDPTRCVVFGDRAAWARAAAMAGLETEPPSWDGGRGFVGRVVLADGGISLPGDVAPQDPRVGAAALGWLEAGAQACQRGALDGLVTAPLSKVSVARAGHPGFTGQTEHLASIAGVRRFGMMLLGHDDRGRWLRVALATTHLPLAQVAAAITPSAVTLAIEMAASACEQLGLPRRRVGVCGLNPHAGEDGLLGDEEGRVIAPAIARCRALGIDVEGPFAADTLFHKALHGAFDVVVAQYHDQGLAPLKLVAFDHGVNWTVGLPWPRTSPDHGTAHDIAWRGKANPGSMMAAWDLARDLARHRRGACRDDSVGREVIAPQILSQAEE
jgi:4-hydroxythreonine-4-phosphate dehydrogenase